MRNQTRKLNILRLFGYISFMCVTKTGFCDDELYENSTCYQSGIVGTCKRITNCPQALKEASKGRPHKMLRCGFVDMDLQIVCCPDPTDTLRILNAESTTTNPLLIWDTRVITATPRNLTGNTKRKCEIMCEKIYKDNNIRAEIETHVINGKSAKYGQFPHMAAIGYAVDDQIDWKKCGASLISSRFLLTAAHCFVCPDCKAIKVRIGVINITDEASAQDIDIKAITVTGYNYTTKHHDIALIELTKDVIMSKTVYPACLYTGTDDPNGLSISGWGQTDSSNLASRSDILQTAEITAVAVGECNTTITKTNRASAKIIVSTQICATYVSDACLGDSGGPLQRPKSVGGFDIVGIISYGIGCGVHPGVYTRVSSFLDWIESVVWPS